MIMLKAFGFLIVLFAVWFMIKKRKGDYQNITAAEWLSGMRNHGWNTYSEKYPPLPERHAVVHEWKRCNS
jgi:hypothetical protein